MHQYLRKWVLTVALVGFVSAAQALESERNSFATPGFTNGDILEPYSTSDVTFTTLSTDPSIASTRQSFQFQ